jgi:alpha-mannosidase
MKCVLPIAGLAMLLFNATVSLAQPGTAVPGIPKYDISRNPVLYTVGYAHLDTEWRWDYEETISVCLKNTLDDNFQRIEKYKPYVFTFSGARRYLMMKEYYPEKYEKLKKYIAQNRWFVGGSSVDECDANVPSPESIIRQVLYGNGFFRAEFNKESVDFLLPDCFGFQAHLPSALAHAGLKGFSTQKLEWGSAVGIPFNIGNWNGPDGKGVIAALNATSYTSHIQERLDTSAYWANRINENGKKYGVFADYRYYGVGDVGGAPREQDVKNLVGSLGHTNSRFTVYPASSDQLFRDLTPEQKSGLPVYSGDLLLTQHSAGSLTSQAYMKRWNRKNEQLALATEPLAVMADWLGGIRYPFARINSAWWLLLGSQMHDILPGTSIPKAYEYAWNDEVVAMNQFAGVFESSAGAVIRALDTRCTGKAVVVYNPLSISRTEIAEAEIQFPEGAPEFVKVFDPYGKEIPSQLIASTKTSVRILFQANLQPFGFAVYDVQPAETAGVYKSTLSAGKNNLDNEYIRLTVNSAGNISSIIDKKLGKEILSAPARIEYLKEHPAYWPAWNMDWNDRKKPPLEYLGGPALITLAENGPLRAIIRVERTTRNSNVVQYIQLFAGREPVVVSNFVKWQSRGVSLKASFPLVASNPVATYNLGLGTITRDNNNEKKYEVPSREWFDLTDKSGNFGVSILEDCKFGSDKPNDNTLRLTLLYTPVTNFYHDQATQDWGIHEFTYGIYSHKGDWRTGQTEWQARRINQPLRVLQVNGHPGFYGKTFSFAQVSSPQIDIRTLKKSENGSMIIVRLQELQGRDIAGVEISLAGKIKDAYEVDGQENRIGDALVKNGKLSVDFTKYAIRSFALLPEPPSQPLNPPVSFEIPLPYNQDVVGGEKLKTKGGFDSNGLTIPAEQFPERITIDGVDFKLGSKAEGQKNVLSCQGQKITLPKTGNYNHLYILAAALTDTVGIFKTGSIKTTLRIQGYRGNIGQFDNRTWDGLGRINGLNKGFIKRDEVALFSTHQCRDTAKIPYQYIYVFKYALDAGPGSKTLQLPDNEAIKIFAITAAEQPFDPSRPALPLYDDFTNREKLAIILPKSFVSDNFKPAATAFVTRNRKLTDLPARLTMKDYADLHMPNGVTVKYFFSGADTNLKNVEDGMNVGAMNDGMFDLLPGDSLADFWSEEGEGRVWIDLQKEIELDSIHLFSVQDVSRGAQSFSLWGATGETSPEVKGDPGATGWSYLSYVPPQDTWGSSKILFTIKPIKGNQKQLRYLLFVSENSMHGPFYFREVDVFEKQH